MIKKRADLIAGAAFLILAAAVFINSYRIRSYTTGSVGPEFFPRVIAVLLFLLSLLLILSAVRSGGTERYTLNPRKKFLVTFFGLFVYALCIQYAGFILMTTVYLFVHFTVLSGSKEKKSLLVHGLVSAGLSAGLYMLFVYGFDLLLPKGIWG